MTCALAGALIFLEMPLHPEEKTENLTLLRLADNKKFNNGILFLNLNKDDIALQEFNEYLEIYRYGIHRRDALKNIAVIYFRKFNFLKALNAYRELYEEFSSTREGSEAHLQMGICYMKMGYYNNAEKIFISIINTDTDPGIVQAAGTQLDLIEIVHK